MVNKECGCERRLGKQSANEMGLVTTRIPFDGLRSVIGRTRANRESALSSFHKFCTGLSGHQKLCPLPNSEKPASPKRARATNHQPHSGKDQKFLVAVRVARLAVVVRHVVPVLRFRGLGSGLGI